MNPMSASVIISHFISVLEKCISFVWILQCAFRGKFSPSFFCPDSVPAQEMRWFMFWDRWFWKDVRDVPWGWNLHLVPLICTRHRLCALYNSAGFINGWWIISVHSPNYFWLFLGPEPRKMSLESSQHGNPTASLPLAFSDPLELGSWHWKKKKRRFLKLLQWIFCFFQDSLHILSAEGSPSLLSILKTMAASMRPGVCDSQASSEILVETLGIFSEKNKNVIAISIEGIELIKCFENRKSGKLVSMICRTWCHLL